LRFLKWHHELVLGQPSGLDPKRAQAFNFVTCDHHFRLLSTFIAEHGVSWQNVYNMNEKAIQLGGGQKGNREKLFFS